MAAPKKVSNKELDLFVKTIPASVTPKINWDAGDGQRKKVLKSKKYSQAAATKIIKSIQTKIGKGGAVTSPDGTKIEGTGDGGFIIVRKLPSGKEAQTVYDRSRLELLGATTKEKMKWKKAAPTPVKAEVEEKAPAPAETKPAPAKAEPVKDKTTKKKGPKAQTPTERIADYKGPVYIDDFFGSADAQQFWADMGEELPTRALPPMTAAARNKMKIDLRSPTSRIIGVPAGFGGSKPKTEQEKTAVEVAKAEGINATNVVNCNEVDYDNLLAGKEKWAQVGGDWFTKWSRGFCGWMAGATVHPKSKRQQLTPEGKANIEAPAELKREMSECREMMYEMRDVLAPSACSYGVKRLLRKE